MYGHLIVCKVHVHSAKCVHKNAAKSGTRFVRKPFYFPTFGIETDCFGSRIISKNVVLFCSGVRGGIALTFLISLLCLVGFGFVALTMSAQMFTRFDHFLIVRIQGAESPVLTYIMKFFTFIGAGMPAVVISLCVILLFYKFLHHRKELILFLWVVLGSALLNVILKLLFQRARPDLYRIIDTNGFSFPSGHSMAAFSVYGIIAFLIWRHIRTAFGRINIILIGALIILAVGISRIYLGVHYPSDVLGGYLASGFWMSVSILLFQKISEKTFQR